MRYAAFAKSLDKVVPSDVTTVQRPGKATLHETREHNERLVLATIYEDGPISRADVSRRTGLTRTTVSDVVAELLVAGLAAEIGRGPSTGGKAPILLRVDDNARQLIGIDLGEGVFRGAMVNLRGEIVHRVEVPTGEGDGNVALIRAFDLIDQLLASASVQPILGIGIGAPGLIDSTDGTVIQAVNIDWRHVPLGALIRERYGLPVYVANDSQVAGLAEHAFGGPRTSGLAVVRVGRGIGAGLILGGTLFQGDGSGAGEIGHLAIVEDGKPCRCGNRGCLETVASTRALLESLALRQVGVQSIEEAATALAAGDPRVSEAVMEAGRYLGTALAAIIGIVNVSRIVLVGPMTAFGDVWLGEVRRAVARHALPLMAEATAIEIGRRDDNAVLLGASALVLTREYGLFYPPRPAGCTSAPGHVGDKDGDYHRSSGSTRSPEGMPRVARADLRQSRDSGSEARGLGAGWARLFARPIASARTGEGTVPVRDGIEIPATATPRPSAEVNNGGGVEGGAFGNHAHDRT